MKQITHCDWLPERAKWSYTRDFIDPACSVKMAGYWPHSFLACLWTSTSSQSINTQKKNLANIQPSWSITLIYILDLVAHISKTNSVTPLFIAEKMKSFGKV